MKNQVLRKILPLFLLVAITLLMCTHAQAGAAFASTSNFHSPVKASECCDFLNQTAVSDPNHLYDQHIATDPDAACIVRLGRSGKYFYQVIAGRENFPVTYVDFPDEEKYCAQTGDALFNDDGNRDENIRIIDHLRTALQTEHTSENANAFIATEIGQLARIGGTS
ncbi:MAG: hypothetical protein ACH346_02390, partial [Chthoniobacterales bacterium]